LCAQIFGFDGLSVEQGDVDAGQDDVFADLIGGEGEGGREGGNEREEE